MPIRDLKAQIARLPEQPGVYVYYNDAGDTLYVGKARVLRDRVRSYLGAHGTSPRIDALLDEAQRLEVIVTDSVMEALALESSVGAVRETAAVTTIMAQMTQAMTTAVMAEMTIATQRRRPRLRNRSVNGKSASSMNGLRRTPSRSRRENR